MQRVATLVCAVVFGAVSVMSIEPALARGGAASIMDSPGYQRRLQESRGQVPVQSTQPYTQPPAVYSGRKWRNRGRR